MVAGGGGGNSSFGNGRGVTVAGGGSTAFGGGAGANPGTQIGNLLSGGGQTPTQVANLPPTTIIPPNQQALNIAAYSTLHGIPMPPGVQAQVDGTAWSPRGNE